MLHVSGKKITISILLQCFGDYLTCFKSLLVHVTAGQDFPFLHCSHKILAYTNFYLYNDEMIFISDNVGTKSVYGSSIIVYCRSDVPFLGGKRCRIKNFSGATHGNSKFRGFYVKFETTRRSSHSTNPNARLLRKRP
jgi:hypothetical protein